MSLCNYAFDEGKIIAAKSYKATRRVEPAGFVFFILREWKVKVDHRAIFEVDLNTKRGDFEISEHDLENVRSYTAFLQKNENTPFSYFYKVAWSRIILTDSATSSESETGDENVSRKKEKKFKSIKTLGLVRNFIAKNKNAYELLNSHDSDETAKIKANYRKIVLLLHPDKSSNQKVPDDLREYERKFGVSGLSRAEKSEMFLLIQDAFTILSDPDMRLEYDSNLPFDEYIPSVEEAKRSDFFQLFAPVFNMNARYTTTHPRWSRAKPVPALGDNESDDRHVEEFYEFWRNFETLRTFSHAAPHLLEDAESREEKRWMERENLKVQRKLVKKEQLRIQKLVDLSQQYDPRLKRKQDRIRMEKLERQKKAQQAKEEEQKRIQMEKERERMENEREAERAKCEKQIAKKLRQQLRLVSQRDQRLAETSANFDKLANFGYDRIKAFSREMYAILDLEFEFDADPTTEYIESLKTVDAMLRELNLEPNKCEGLNRLFSTISSELDPLQAPTAPAGAVSTQNSDTPRAADANAARGVAPENRWTNNDLARLARAVELNPPGTPGRWNLISKFVKTKSAAQCIEMARLVASNADISEHMAAEDAPATPSAPAGPNSPGSPKVDSSNAGEAAANDQSGWSKEQQSAFEAALAKYPSTIDPLVRWRKIASEVPGKTPKECLARFKQIKAAIVSKRT